MDFKWPRLVYKEECLREGMQIEDAGISVDDKVRLLDALSDTGLKHIVVGSFVSPRYTPQMARIDEIVQRFTPRPGVTYTALLVNEKAVERAKPYSPPLTIEAARPVLSYHLCDVFMRRNFNRSQNTEIARWPVIVSEAKERGATEAGIGVAAAWGSNFVGGFTLAQRMEVLEAGYRMWDEAGVPVTSVSLIDPMAWCAPHRVEEQIVAIKDRWPEISRFYLHLHDARGMALLSAYAAMRVLEPEDTIELDGTIGGIGGCPYCGTGRATGMMPTEDAMHLFEDLGIETGVDLDRLIDCVWMLEEILGRPTYGHVSKAGPRPDQRAAWFDPNMPFVETLEEARHFKLGPSVYEGQIHPWREPIRSDQRPDTLA